MATATRAAAAGGVTTVVDMPLNSAPCTTTPAQLRRKLAAAGGANQTWVDVGLWAGLVPANARSASELKALVRGGALGFKAFMAPSGIDDFPHVSPEEIAAALPAIRGLGVPLLVHAELVDGDVAWTVGAPGGAAAAGWWRRRGQQLLAGVGAGSGSRAWAATPCHAACALQPPSLWPPRLPAGRPAGPRHLAGGAPPAL